jgi:hypothetical protein
MADTALPRPRGSATICLPMRRELYDQCIDSPTAFRRLLDQAFQQTPELFPAAFAAGYTLKDARYSAKLGLRLRRIECKATGAAFTVRPDFVMPYMTAWTDDVRHPLFLRSFGVPFWALAHVFGRDPMYWYRLEVSLGRNSVVGTTVRQAQIPEHLLADEHHQTCDGVKVYIATTVAAGCCLGAAVAQTADAVALQQAYGVFQQEASNVQPPYRPQTVNTDGWAATQSAWRALFPLIVILRCFLHGWLSIRERAKHLGELFQSVGEKVWDAYHAETRQRFGQRLRRLAEWAKRSLRGVVLEQVLKLCGRGREYGQAYRQPQGHRTSNMLDRVMKLMQRYFDSGQHLHGSKEAIQRHSRAWALLHNFRPWSPASRRENSNWASPAERLNQHRYHPDWLHNLLVSASMAGYRR